MSLSKPDVMAGADAGVVGAAPDPRVWAIAGYRAGEHSQILALAEALGWPFELKQLDYRKLEWRTNVFRGTGLGGIDPAARACLSPPWPDLVIAAGMRNEPVCRWIRDRSGGRTRIVHIGRPWARPENFDLIITTPQYRLARRPNVLENTLTLHRVTPGRLREAGEALRPRLAGLPSPRVTVVVGGNSGPYTLGPRAASRLAEQVNALAADGSVMVSTSARTDPEAAQALEEAIRVPELFYRWRANDSENPYFGFLALADTIVVTADSISMISEACATGKPVYLFDIGEPDGTAGTDSRFSGRFYRWAMRWLPQRATRDISLVHRRVVESGCAAWLGQDRPTASKAAEGDLDRAVRAVRKLLET